MAKRLNNRHQSMVREKIKASQLINRLQDHVLGEVELSNSQVRAATYLVNQAIGAPPQKLEHEGTVTLEQLVAGVTKLEAEESEHVTH